MKITASSHTKIDQHDNFTRAVSRHHDDRGQKQENPEKPIFTISAEIHARSLVNFYGQYANRHMNLKFVRRVSEREREIRQICYRKKQIDVSF